MINILLLATTTISTLETNPDFILESESIDNCAINFASLDKLGAVSVAYCLGLIVCMLLVDIQKAFITDWRPAVRTAHTYQM